MNNEQSAIAVGSPAIQTLLENLGYYWHGPPPQPLEGVAVNIGGVPWRFAPIGIDLGKTVFHFVGLNAPGEVVVRRKGSRTQLLRFTSNLRECLIGMEACGRSHFLGRALREQGHDVRLTPAQYVKTNKNDYICRVAPNPEISTTSRTPSGEQVF
jgi:hypothetical protein